MKTKCTKCDEYCLFYGQDVKCIAHREPSKEGFYLVGCSKCDNVLMSHDKEDSLCIAEI